MNNEKDNDIENNLEPSILQCAIQNLEDNNKENKGAIQLAKRLQKLYSDGNLQSITDAKDLKKLIVGVLSD